MIFFCGYYFCPYYGVCLFNPFRIGLQNSRGIKCEHNFYVRIEQGRIQGGGGRGIRRGSCASIISLDEDIYPTIFQLVLINYTLPVSVASDERSFSSLTRLKSYLRYRMRQERLSGLPLLNIHRNKHCYCTQ
jgi:hypothetical protein